VLKPLCVCVCVQRAPRGFRSRLRFRFRVDCLIAGFILSLSFSLSRVLFRSLSSLVNNARLTQAHVCARTIQYVNNWICLCFEKYSHVDKFFFILNTHRERGRTRTRAHTHTNTHTHTQQPVIILKMGGKSAALRSVKTEIMQRLQ